MCRAARPMVWISESPDRRKPSLSASRIATSETSGKIQAFAQKIDSDENVEFSPPQPAQNFDAVQGFDFRMQVAALHSDFGVVLGKIFRHTFGQCGDEHPLVLLRAQPDLVKQIVDLAADRPDFNLGIGQAGRANDLLHDDAAGFRQFIRSGRRRNIDKLIRRASRILRMSAAGCPWQTEDENRTRQIFFSRPVAVIHAAKLRHRLMAFIDEHQRVLRQIIEQSRRRLARHAAGKMTRIILDTVAVADFFDHLHIEQRPLMDALRFQQPALLFEKSFPALQAPL